MAPHDKPFLLLAAMLALLHSSPLFAAPQAESRSSFELSAPAIIRPGEPLLVWVSEAAGLPAAAEPAAGDALGLDRSAFFGGKVVLLDEAGLAVATRPHFSVKPGLYGSLLPLDFEAKPGEGRLVLRDGLGLSLALPRPISIVARSFECEDIKLDSANTAIRSEPDPQKTAEAKLLYDILDSAHADAVYLDGPFLSPTQSGWRSAGFGDKRRYLYSNGGVDTSVHAGVDIAVPVGTKVRAAGRGRVVFAGMRIVTGNTVIVEHLPGLYSIYMHLSKIQVRIGEVVERGAAIALSGKTGLATGPHLHWELRAGGEAVDPDYWLAPSHWLPAGPLD
jgi:murein DD-endopeptidase MepM/ murein hydrolase activator NlpD